MAVKSDEIYKAMEIPYGQEPTEPEIVFGTKEDLKMSTPGILDQLLKILELATVTAGALSGHPELGSVALNIEQIATAAIAAHEQVTGKPFDISLLKPIDPVA